MSSYPVSLQAALVETLNHIGDSTPIRSAQPVGGGDINHAIRLESGKNVYLLKWNAKVLPGMFQCEARGLELIAATQTVRVPRVLAVAEAEGDRPAYLLLEYLEGSRSGDAEKLGEQLAELHRKGKPAGASAYGLDHDNYIGSSRQMNDWRTDWADFFAEYRLRPQMALAHRNGRLTGDRQKRLERLIERLSDLLGGVKREPSLIHGDLWSGNVIPGPDGLALIDPAVSYSDREAEIAFTELFGGFSARFYQAYQAAWPLAPGYAERRDLYNLYHLLNHLNLFGESYAYSVDSILKIYT